MLGQCLDTLITAGPLSNFNIINSNESLAAGVSVATKLDLQIKDDAKFNVGKSIALTFSELQFYS